MKIKTFVPGRQFIRFLPQVSPWLNEKVLGPDLFPKSHRYIKNNMLPILFSTSIIFGSHLPSDYKYVKEAVQMCKGIMRIINFSSKGIKLF
jgi:hypothetical protein